MPVQLSLDGIDGSSQPTNGVYFAVLPTVDAARLIARRTRHLCRAHGLKGSPVKPERLHVSLHHLGDYADPPPGIVAAACEAAAAVLMPPFELVFDRIVSFDSNPGRHPFVLAGGDGVAGLIAFRQVLGTAMQKAGLWRCVKPHYLPHLTMVYGDHHVAERAVEAVGWTVKEFVLVHSLYGQTRHVQLGRWSLRG
jgi:2'-5' RNA ligase